MDTFLKALVSLRQSCVVAFGSAESTMLLGCMFVMRMLNKDLLQDVVLIPSG